MARARRIPKSAAATPAFPNDIVDQLLAASPNFDALHASVGVSKTWREIYEAHPISIAQAVARNVVGPALPQAMRFLRYPYPEKEENEWDAGGTDDEDEDEDEDSDATEDDSEDEDGDGVRGKRKGQNTKAPIAKARASLSEGADVGALSPDERKELQENAEIVQQLENLFSSRCVRSADDIPRVNWGSDTKTALLKRVSSRPLNRTASRVRCTALCCIASYSISLS
jgi:hypothetical protein